MRHTDEVTLTLKGLGKPKTYLLPRVIAEELEAYIDSQVNRERISASSLFPAVFDSVQGPATALRGLRLREELTQKQLADKLGIRQHHLSEMEHGKRPIGKEMAKRLAEVLNTNWKTLM